MKTLWIPSLIGAVSLLPTTPTTGPFTVGNPDSIGPDLVASELECVVQRANTFLASTQEATALAAEPDGNWTVVWHSRRQEEGTYGVYARRFGPAGDPLSEEQRVNATVAGMQMQPCVASDEQGGTWFAWRSFQQDGDEGSIVARRFDAQLERATAEQIVNQVTRGHQTDPSIAALPDGGAMVVWTGPDEAEARTRIFGRRLGPDGTTQGPEFSIGDADGCDRLPHIATDRLGRAVVCWARTDDEGTPTGVFARVVDSSGQPSGPEFRVDPETSIQPIEPTLSVTSDGNFAIAWLDLRGASSPLMWRLYEWQGEELKGERVHEHGIDGPGYTNGHAIDLTDDGSLLVAWSRHGSNDRSARLFAQVFEDGDRARTEAFPIHDLEAHAEQFAVGRGTARAHLLADGRMGFAWFGDAGQGDSTGANISVLLPADYEDSNPASKAGKRPVQSGPTWGSAEKGASPHEPPSFDSRRATERPPSTAPLVGPNGTFDFLGIPDTGWGPPDPHMAVGPDHVVLMTNGAIAFFDTSGQFQFQDMIEGGSGFWGSQGAQGFVFDPEVLWDPHSQRFMAMAAERADGQTQPHYLLAISDDADPNGAWFKYRINVLAAVGDTDIDSPNMAVDEDVIYLGSDFFGPDKYYLLMIDKSSVLNGGAIASTDTLIAGDQSFGMPLTHDAGAPAQYMVHADEFVLSNQIEIWAITDALTSPQLQSTSLTVPFYQHPENVPQKGTSTRIELFEARFWSCLYRNGSLWATHHSGSSQAVQRWYQIEMQGWPTSGNSPVLVQSGSIELDFPVRTFFGSIAVDADDNMALTFARASDLEFPSMAQVTRAVTDPLGTTQPPVSVALSTGPASDRWGDYSGCSADPDEAGVFWGNHEYLTAGSWKTRVARFVVCPLGQPYCVSATHSGGQQAHIGNAGTPRISDNEFSLTIADGPANKFGLFFYGPNQIQVSFGDGFRCVGGQTQRINPVQMTDGSGNLIRQVDLTSPATAPITANSTWNFQFWFRDPMGPGGSGFNLSDGLSVTFCD